MTEAAVYYWRCKRCRALMPWYHEPDVCKYCHEGFIFEEVYYDENAVIHLTGVVRS